MKRGLTLAETVLAIGFLAVIAISMAGVFTHLLNSSAKGNDLTAGRLLAQKVLDRAARSGPPSWGFTSITNVAQDITTHDSRTQTTFVYNLIPSSLKQDTGLPGTIRELYFLEVTVTWWNDETRAEFGELRTTLGQSVLVEQ